MFSTMTSEEIGKFMGARVDTEGVQVAQLDDTNLADAFDWRVKGAVNPVKNQGKCGSCWAFGATAVTEAAHFIATGTLQSLSEQEIISCDITSYGCHGGWQSHAFDLLKYQNQALEIDYPYISSTGDSGTCDLSKEANAKVHVTGYNSIRPESVSQLKAAVNQGVVTVTIEADKPVFRQYTSGILDSEDCGTALNHAVAVVGYGSEGEKEYYIVRNSWSASWGDQGYIKIAAVDGPGICGIQRQSYIAQTN